MPPAASLTALAPVLALAVPQDSAHGPMAAVPPGMTVSLDLMGQTCGFMNGADPAESKPAQLVAMGYVRGYADAAAAACDGVDRGAAFCRRLFAGRVKGAIFEPPAVAGAVETYCGSHPHATVGDAVRQFMRDQGVLDPASAPSGSK